MCIRDRYYIVLGACVDEKGTFLLYESEDAENWKYRCPPVSYTHLDVYKSQVSGYLERRELSGRNRADGERGCKVYGYKENRYP